MGDSGRLVIGTSGWQYRHWRDGFYQGLPQRQWLDHYARHFPGLEINVSFYRLQRPATLRNWCSRTPPTFCFSLKAHRYTTHVKRLRDPGTSVSIERQHSALLGDKLKVVLWQLPASFGIQMPRLEAFAQALQAWPQVRHCVEFRHPSWFVPSVAEYLGRERIAVCQSDAADWPLWPCVTTDLVYLRLHGHEQTYVSAYDEAALRSWAARIRQWRTDGCSVHCYFDNDALGAAPANALQLLALLKE